MFCHLASSSQEDKKWILSIESTLNCLTAISLGSTFYSSFCLDSKHDLIFIICCAFSDLQPQKMEVPSCTQSSSHKAAQNRILEMHHYKSLNICTRGDTYAPNEWVEKTEVHWCCWVKHWALVFILFHWFQVQTQPIPREAEGMPMFSRVISTRNCFQRILRGI